MSPLRLTSSRRAPAAVLAAFLASGFLVVGAAPAGAVSPGVVVGEVYGGGGNSGAILRNDFIELFNRGTTTVSLAGWSVQYASATGSSWAVTNLSGTVPPGGRHLVREAAGTGGTTDLPAADSIGNIAMSATAGKVALVSSTTALACSTGCASAPGVVDLLGYGATASSFEGTGPAPGLSNTIHRDRPAVDDQDQRHQAPTVGVHRPIPSGGRAPRREVDGAHDLGPAWPPARSARLRLHD